jgi:hypothetical protein
VSDIDVRASDDILDESANPVAQNFDSMINASAAAHREQLVAQMQSDAPMQAQPAAQTAQPPADYWFMHQPQAVPGQATFVDAPVVAPSTQAPALAAPQAVDPTAEEEALVEKLKAENSSMSAAYGHMKTLKTPEQLAAEARAAAQAQAAAKPKVTPDKQAAIINLANNDDLDVATIARQAHKDVEQGDDGEVVISLR